MEGKAIYAGLLKVQQEINVPKGRDNNFGHYKYRNVEDIITAAKPLLQKNGLILVMTDAIEQIGDRYYLKATAKLIDIATGDSIENTAYAREPLTKKGMDDMMVTGSCSTYARRYALNGLFAIDVGTIDPDSNDYPREEEDGQNAARATRNSNANNVSRTNGNGVQADSQAAQSAKAEYNAAVHALNDEMNRTGASGEDVKAIAEQLLHKSRVKDMTPQEIKTLTASLEDALASRAGA